MDTAVTRRPILSLKHKKTHSNTDNKALYSRQLAQRELSVWWPRPSAPHYSWVLPHPTGGITFCDFPEIQAFGHTFEAAPTFLLYGKHLDRHKGFGCLHILQGHWREIGLKTHEPSLATVDAVAAFVASICSRGAKITCEFAGMRGNHRPLIVRGSRGTVVLEYLICRESQMGYYSVVTAMATTKAKGSVIGAL